MAQQDRPVEGEAHVVYCECGPDNNPGCKLGAHPGHLVEAVVRVCFHGDPDDYAYVCAGCLESLATGTDSIDNTFQLLAEEEGDDAGRA